MNQNKVNIGTDIDLQKLLDTRLLVQAGSGGGKSHALRKIIESVGKKVQQIIIDPEGEFVTLREKFDFVLVGKDGDIGLNLKYSEMLAHKLLETGVSAIIDLYEFKQHERILFVKRFLDALVNAPKELWHSCLVYIDEAHIFCPESSKSESMQSVIDICTRGRKRGFAAVLATQRLSKLHKDAAAECLNKMIGRTGLDIDRKRAGDELGFTNKTDNLGLRDLEPGTFFAFGPAISTEVIKFRVGNVITTHLQSGHRITEAPPTPDAVKKIMSKLATIPEEAEKELISKADMQKEITRLRAEVTRLTGQKPKVVESISSKELEQMKRGMDKIIEDCRRHAGAAIGKLQDAIKKLDFNNDKIRALLDDSERVRTAALQITGPANPAESSRINVTAFSPVIKQQVSRIESKPGQISATVKYADSSLGKCAREIILFLARYPDRKFSKAQVAIATGYSAGSGGFKNALSELNSRQLISRDGSLRISPDGFDFVNSHYGPVETKPYDIYTYSQNLNKCEKEIYSVLLENPDREFSKEEMGAATGYSASSGGFKNALSRMNTLELIERRAGKVRLNPELVELM